MKIKLLFVLFSILPVLCFHFQNENYPSDDAGDYMITSQQNYYSFTEKSFVDGLHSTFVRGNYKPIFHPIIGTGLLFLTKGDTRFAIKLYCVLFFALFSFAIYSIFEIYLDVISGWISALIVVWSTWVFQSSLFYNAEIALMATAFLAIFFYCKFSQTKTLNHAICFHLSFLFAILIRPVEAIFFLIILEVSILHKLFQLKIFKKNDLFNLFILSIECLLIILAPFFLLNRSYSQEEFLLICALLFIGLYRAIGKHTNFQLKVVALCLISLTLFYLPKSWGLMHWVFDTSIGSSVQKVNPSPYSLGDYVLNILRFSGVYPLIVFTIACVSLFFPKVLKFRFWNKSEWGVFVLNAFLFLLVGAISVSRDPRYFYCNFILILVLMIFLLMQFELVSRYDRPFKQFILALLLIFSSLNTYMFNQKKNDVFSRMLKVVGESLQVSEGTEPKVLSDFLRDLSARLDGDARILFVDTSFRLVNILNKFSLSVRTCERSSNIVINHYNGKYSIESFLGFSQNYDYILLGPLMKIRNEDRAWLNESIEKIVYDLTSPNRPAEYQSFKPEELVLKIKDNDYKFTLLKTGRAKPGNLRLTCT